MTVITMVTDPATDKQIPKAKGIIKRINIKPINADGSPKITNITKGPNAGKSIKSTHRYSILLAVGENQEWISFGEGEVKAEKYADQFQIKVGEVYKNLLPGMEISVYPVDARKWMKDVDGTQVEQTSYQGKKKNINLLDESGAVQPSAAKPAATNKPAANAAGGNKIFGEVISVENGVAQVKDKNSGATGPVVLGEHEGEVTVGGRIGAIVDNDGKILSGFKAYGVEGAAGAAGSGGRMTRGSTGKDNSGMETGHAINGALNIIRAGIKFPAVDLAKVVHDVTVKVKASERAKEENKGMSDYDVGASVGHAVLNATRDIKKAADITLEQVAEKLEAYAHSLLEKVAGEVLEYVKAGGAAGIAAAALAQKEAEEKAKAEAEEKAKADSAAMAPAATTPSNHIDMTYAPMDFDDDIPF